nr:MAG TPA: hypothetical protein [Caudoviricetes sp.]
MKITIEIDDEKKVICGVDQTADTAAESQQPEPETDPLDPEEAERYAAASDLANCCEYLEDSELIKLKLMIQKCETRKERDGK